MVNRRRVLRRKKRVSAREAEMGGMLSHDAITGQADVSVESKRFKSSYPIEGGQQTYTKKIITETPKAPEPPSYVPPPPVVRESAPVMEEEPETYPYSGKIEKIKWTKNDVVDFAQKARPDRAADFIQQLDPKDIAHVKSVLGDTHAVVKELAKRESGAAPTPAPSAPVTPSGVSAEVPEVSQYTSTQTEDTPITKARRWWEEHTAEVISDNDKKAYVGGYRGPAKASLDQEYSRAQHDYIEENKRLNELRARARELPKLKNRKESEERQLVDYINNKDTPQDKRAEAQKKLLDVKSQLIDIRHDIAQVKDQTKTAEDATENAKWSRDKASMELGNWQAAFTKGSLEWRQKYTDTAWHLKQLKERGDQYQKMGGDLGGPKIADNLSKMVQGPLGPASKISDRWSSIMGKAPGYREDRSVTDVVGYGGRKEDWTKMFPAVTGLGSSVRTLVKPTVGVAGSASARMQFDLTTPAKRITLGDISAAGIPTVRNIPQPQEMVAVPTPSTTDQTGQTVAGTPAWQRARRKKIVRKKGLMYGGGMVRGSLHLETGRVNLGAGKASFGVGHFGMPAFNPMGNVARFRTTAPTIETPKVTGGKKKVNTVSTPAPKVESPKLSAIDIGKSSIGIAPGRMQEFTVAQCHANVVSADIMKGISKATIKRKKKKRGG